jgi:hypothetical protein
MRLGQIRFESRAFACEAPRMNCVLNRCRFSQAKVLKVIGERSV